MLKGMFYSEKNKQDFELFLEDCINDSIYDEFYDTENYYDFWLTKVSEGNIEDGSLLLFFNNNEIVDFAPTLNIFNLDFIYLNLYREDKYRNCEIEIISLLCPNHILYLNDMNPPKHGYKKCDLTSTINDEHTYNLFDNTNYWVLGNNEYVLRDKFEELYFPEYTENLEFKMMTTSDMNDYYDSFETDVFGIPLWHNGSSTMAGFHYFRIGDYKDDARFLVAMIDNLIIGIIYYGVWGKQQAVSYIDVNEKYQKKGIATRMIIELNKYINTEMDLYITDESSKGKLCQIKKHFKDLITGTNVITRENSSFY